MEKKFIIRRKIFMMICTAIGRFVIFPIYAIMYWCYGLDRVLATNKKWTDKIKNLTKEA